MGFPLLMSHCTFTIVSGLDKVLPIYGFNFRNVSVRFIQVLTRYCSTEIRAHRALGEVHKNMLGIPTRGALFTRYYHIGISILS